MIVEDNEILQEITNTIANISYDDNGKPYLSLEFDAKIMDEKGFRHQTNIKIFKIKLNNIKIDVKSETIRNHHILMPPTISINRKISFELGINDQGDAFMCKFDE